MKIISSEKLASLVRQNRCNLDLTQETLGAQTGINTSHITRIEDGSYLPSSSQLEALMETLSLSLDQLCIDKENMSIEDLYHRCNIQTPEAKKQFDTMVHMMITLRQQVILHNLYEKEVHSLPSMSTKSSQLLKEDE